MKLFQPVSSTATYVEYLFECQMCLDVGCIEVPTMQMGKITIVERVRCPKCNADISCG